MTTTTTTTGQEVVLLFSDKIRAPAAGGPTCEAVIWKTFSALHNNNNASIIRIAVRRADTMGLLLTVKRSIFIYRTHNKHTSAVAPSSPRLFFVLPTHSENIVSSTIRTAVSTRAFPNCLKSKRVLVNTF